MDETLQPEAVEPVEAPVAPENVASEEAVAPAVDSVE